MSPGEMRRFEVLAVRCLAPFSHGASRTAKLAYHSEPLADALSASCFHLAKELWKSREAAPGAMEFIHGSLFYCNTLTKLWAVAE